MLYSIRNRNAGNNGASATAEIQGKEDGYIQKLKRVLERKVSTDKMEPQRNSEKFHISGVVSLNKL